MSLKAKRQAQEVEADEVNISLLADLQEEQEKESEVIMAGLSSMVRASRPVGRPGMQSTGRQNALCPCICLYGALCGLWAWFAGTLCWSVSPKGSP